MTKDGAGICHTDYRLDNSTTISSVFPKEQKTYLINGQQVQGWFAVDFTSEQLYNNVSCEYNNDCPAVKYFDVFLLTDNGNQDKMNLNSGHLFTKKFCMQFLSY